MSQTQVGQGDGKTLGIPNLGTLQRDEGGQFLAPALLSTVNTFSFRC
jgi:hypothetical protein